MSPLQNVIVLNQVALIAVLVQLVMFMGRNLPEHLNRPNNIAWILLICVVTIILDFAAVLS